MPHVCPQCRAFLAADETCREYFNSTQLKEIEQPAYYAVHHLSVPCWMLQHNAYSRQGWLEVRNLLAKFMHEGLTPATARRQIQIVAEGRRREWSFTKGARLPGVEALVWSFTIANVRLDTAEVYCADVRRWAESILTDTAELIRSAETSPSK